MNKPNLNFLDLPAHLTDLDRGKVAILCLPYEATTTYGKGTQFGPQAIVDASHQVELYDEELDLEPGQIGISTLMPFDSFDVNAENAMAQINGACYDLLKQDKFVIGLGGEHTITVGMVEAFKKRYPDLWVLQLDAHSDLRNEYHGSKLNHACVMARVNEICPFLGLGIRSGIKDERALLKSPSRIHYAHELHQNSDWVDVLIEPLGEPVYITIDLDFFDPAIVPAVGTPEPGGFFWYETLKFLKNVIRTRKVVGFDIVELRPRTGFPESDFLAAKLAYKLIGYVLEKELQASNQKIA